MRNPYFITALDSLESLDLLESLESLDLLESLDIHLTSNTCTTYINCST